MYRTGQFLPLAKPPRKDGEYLCGYHLSHSHIPITFLHNFIPSILPFPHSSCCSFPSEAFFVVEVSPSMTGPLSKKYSSKLERKIGFNGCLKRKGGRKHSRLDVLRIQASRLSVLASEAHIEAYQQNSGTYLTWTPPLLGRLLLGRSVYFY